MVTRGVPYTLFHKNLYKTYNYTLNIVHNAQILIRLTRYIKYGIIYSRRLKWRPQKLINIGKQG